MGQSGSIQSNRAIHSQCHGTGTLSTSQKAPDDVWRHGLLADCGDTDHYLSANICGREFEGIGCIYRMKRKAGDDQ